MYAYADQMVADAWLALPDEHRKRFAPCFASFDPTDLAAIAHVRRMYHKYPKMWRAVGEVSPSLAYSPHRSASRSQCPRQYRARAHAQRGHACGLCAGHMTAPYTMHSRIYSACGTACTCVVCGGWWVVVCR